MELVGSRLYTVLLPFESMCSAEVFLSLEKSEAKAAKSLAAKAKETPNPTWVARMEHEISAVACKHIIYK